MSWNRRRAQGPSKKCFAALGEDHQVSLIIFVGAGSKKSRELIFRVENKKGRDVSISAFSKCWSGFGCTKDLHK